MHLQTDSTIPSWLLVMFPIPITCNTVTTTKSLVTTDLFQYFAFVFIPKDIRVVYVPDTLQSLYLPVNQTSLGWNTADV